MKIGELSRLTGASTRSIRHYEKKKILPAVRLGNDYREFDESAVERIRIIQLYLGLGLTVEQIENILRGENSGPEEYEFCEEMLELYRHKADRIQEQIRDLQTVKARLDRQIKAMLDKKRARERAALSEGAEQTAPV
ncbi:DNA-binding transcriptional MerR regulator [Paenibacillus mucilaginosus]|uniref:MerR family transcriptional regulator n=1 Tax=Paenibacillus mucilaginosus TaxID=61624 RepID=UPI003D1BFC89